MTNITKTAEHLLEELHAADMAYRAAKIIEHRRAEREAEERILSIKINRDKIAVQLRDAEKVSWERIAGAMGTKAAKTARDAVEAGRALSAGVKTTPAPEIPDRFEWDAAEKMLTVTLTVADVEPVLEFTPYTLEDVNADAGLLSAQFFCFGSGGWVSDDSAPGHPVHALFFSPKFTELRTTAEAFVEGSGA